MTLSFWRSHLASRPHRAARPTLATTLVALAAFALVSACHPRRAPTNVVDATRTTGVGHGLCDNACDKYIACGGVMARRVCVDECTLIYAEEDSLASLMAMQCDAYLSYIDGPSTAN